MVSGRTARRTVEGVMVDGWVKVLLWCEERRGVCGCEACVCDAVGKNDLSDLRSEMWGVLAYGRLVGS